MRGIRAMSTEATNRAEALAELAAIRRAKPVYRQPKAAAKADTAEAARVAKAEAEAAARAALPKSTTALPEAKPARLAWHVINGREYAAAEAREFWAEQRQLDRAARQATRAAAEAARLAAYGPAALLHVMPEAELRAKAKAARAETAAELYLDVVARADALGVDVAEVLEADAQDALLAAEARDETFGAAPEAGAYSVMSPKSYALFRDWTRAKLASAEAEAGRAALDAMGVTAQAVVTVPFGGHQLTISELAVVPSLETAKARAKAAKRAAKAARAKAKAAIKRADAGHLVREHSAKAEAEAGRLAAIAQRAAAKAARAKVVKAAAKAAEEIPGHVTGWCTIPVAKLPMAEAAKAGSLPVRHAVGRMPATYAYRGPSAKAARAKADNTAAEAIANVMGQTAEAEAAMAEALRLSVLSRMAELAETAKAARLEAAEATRAARRARAAAALRIKRRAAKNK
jgi:hypothetical protein